MKAARTRAGVLATLALGVALWLVASGALLGFDLGKYSDDYSVSLRTHETGAYEGAASPWTRWNYFWRPLHLLAVYGLGTALWEHDWINHAISALAHVFTAGALWRLLIRLGIGPWAAGCAACVFVSCPLFAEAVLWPAALGSVVSAGLALWLGGSWVRWQEATSAGAEHVRRGVLLGVGTFVVACWHEQAAACAAALPVLALALPSRTDLPSGAFEPAEGRRRTVSRLLRGLRAAMACAVGIAAYAAAFLATVPAGRRGSVSTLVDSGSIDDRFMAFANATLSGLLGGAARARVLDGLDRAWLWGPSVWIVGALGVGVLVWSAMWLRERPGPQLARVAHARHGWIAVLGLTLAVLAMAPVFMVRENAVFPRYFYMPCAGLAIVCAAALDRLGGRRLPRALASVAVGSVCVGGAISCVGWQLAMRDRSRADATQMEQLRALAPDPPRGAVFVPMRLEDARGFAQLRPGNAGVLGALAHPWSCWAYVQRGYGRSDLSATHLRPGAPVPISVGAESIRYNRAIADQWGRVTSGRNPVPRGLVVGFSVDQDGRVRLENPWEGALSR